jgi:D-inositol-3-phosphate glycosyltransferase
MARVKNRNLADGDIPEPTIREIGEEQVVQTADRLVANTQTEAQELIELYDADPARVRVVHPGVDLQNFVPGSKSDARHELGLKTGSVVMLFVGRIQPLKAPDVLLKAAAELIRHQPELKDRLVVPICGGPSGTGLARPDALHELAAQLGITENVIFEPPSNRAKLVKWLQAADVCLIPSYNESFGLVALEAQACGTPVIAANVGGLPTAVSNNYSGLLVDGHNPHDWAHVLERFFADVKLQEKLSAGALDHAAKFSWEATTEHLIEVYEEAIDSALERRKSS